jgi:hypothetical protein
MGPESDDREIVEKVLRQRADDALREIRRHYPSATVSAEIDRGRGIITLCQDRFVLSKEFVETAESLTSAHCMSEYARVLMGKARLVLVVPKPHAAAVRARLLEFNNWWLFYYQVYFYDEQGNIKRVDRRTWCELAGRPYEAPPRAPEIV